MGAGSLFLKWGTCHDDEDLLGDVEAAGVTRDILAEAYRRQLPRPLAEAAGVAPGQLRLAALAWGVVKELPSELQRGSQGDVKGLGNGNT